MLAYLLSILVGFISPLIFYLIYKDRSDFVRRVSREALNLEITAAIVNVAVVFVLIVSGAVMGILFAPLAILIWILLFVFLFGYSIAVLVFVIIGAIRANAGEVYKVPFILRLVK